MTKSEAIQKVLDIARAEIGYREKQSNSQLDDKTANAGSANWTKYARDLDAVSNFYNGKKNGYAWCDMFHDWIHLKAWGAPLAMQVLCQPEYSAGAGCKYSAQYYKNAGRWHTSNPESGDQIFFYYGGDINHTGIVESVSGNTVTTIEGNTSDVVARRTYNTGNSTIAGYGTPRYELVLNANASSANDTVVTRSSPAGSTGSMKYSTSNPPLVCMMTQSTCYKGTGTMEVKGVLWHSTGANNPWLKRYVQPDDNASNKDELLRLLGTNPNRNDWNHISIEAGLNAWIGKLADGTMATVQTMPWNYRPWGCGAGNRGSCNNGWIQFEICEDSLGDQAYFNAVYQEACEFTAYICKMYGIDPNGSVSFGGVSVPTILCHQDSYKLGLGSNHADVYHWFNRYGKTMDDVRSDVSRLLSGSGGDVPSGNIPAGGTPSGGSDPAEDGYYIVKPGDSMWSIARQLLGDGSQWSKIMQANNLKSTMIYAGQRLIIPGMSSGGSGGSSGAQQETASAAMPVLKYGAIGMGVKLLQAGLNAHNARPVLDVDGEFGNNTLSALRSFNTSAGISPNDVAGGKTWEALAK